PTWVRRRAAISSLSRIASCTRSLRAPASGKPRSPRTSPLPASTVSISVFCSIAYLVVSLGRFQALADQADILMGRAHTRGRFLLEAVQDIDGFLKKHRVQRPERMATKPLAQLKDRR